MADKKLNRDLPDSAKDKQKLKPDEAVLDLPDVEDIPGQENVHVPELREMADTTISSDDEEGAGIWEDDNATSDLSGDRLGATTELTENDLRMSTSKLEARLDEEDLANKNDSDIDITDDSISEDSDVTPDEVEALERTDNMDTQDNENLYRAELDDTDFDGEKLNENDDDVSGKDLDVPGEEEDDANEEIGEEDEENNEYSLGDTE